MRIGGGRTVAVWLTAGTLALAQGEDIFQRLQRCLAAGQGDAAADVRAKNFAQVEARLESKNAANDEERAELLALRGAVLFLDGKIADSASAFRQSEKIRTLSDGDQFTFAMGLVKLGEDGGARQVLTQLTDKHPESAIYIYWLGKLDYDERRYSQAVEKLQKATKLDGESVRAWDSLGLAWDMQGQREMAREAFDKAVTLNRSQSQPSARPPLNLGYLLLRMGKTEAAEDSLRESLTYDPALSKAHYYLGRLLETERQDADAIKEYRNALAGDGGATDACYSLALLFRKLHRNAEAEAMFVEFRRRKNTEGLK